MDHTKQLTFEEGIRIISKLCKVKKHKCGVCPMRIIPDGCWFKHYPSGWRMDSFLEKCNGTFDYAKAFLEQQEVQHEVD